MVSFHKAQAHWKAHCVGGKKIFLRVILFVCLFCYVYCLMCVKFFFFVLLFITDWCFAAFSSSWTEPNNQMAFQQMTIIVFEWYAQNAFFKIFIELLSCCSWLCYSINVFRKKILLDQSNCKILLKTMF